MVFTEYATSDPIGSTVDSDIQWDRKSIEERNAKPQHRGDARFRIKMICNWCSPQQLCDQWNKMSQGNYRWNDIQITWEDRDIDFYVIINKPSGNEFYVPERTIVFQMEPWCQQEYQKWGVKTWGEWSKPDPSKFLQVRSHREYVKAGMWELHSTYSQLKTTAVTKTNQLSTICSSKYFDPGHIQRVDFLRFLEKKNDDVVKIDIFGFDNSLGFSSYVGPAPPKYKEAALLPYKYFIAVENNREWNYITEKMWEALLCECLCFYWGCPNAGDILDPRAFISLELEDFDRSFQILKQAIQNNEWEKRIDVIRQEKQKVLEHYQFFPTLERILRNLKPQL
jgi:hypothetical protein